jgi:hypothetical protein
MPRGVKDSPEVRAAKRKARNAFTFSDAAYKHYDPAKEGYGSPDEWAAQAEAMAEGRGTFKRAEGRKSQTKVTKDMAIMGLLEMPADISGLRQAMLRAMESVGGHYKGEGAKVRAVIDAFKRLCEQY